MREEKSCWESEANPGVPHCVEVEKMRMVKQHPAIMVTIFMVAILLSCALINGIMEVCFG